MKDTVQLIPLPRVNYKILILFCILFSFSGRVTAKSPVAKTDFEKAYQLYTARNFREALNVFASEKEGSPRYASALVIKGFVFTDSISFDEGKKYFEKAELLLANTKDIKLKCKNYFGLGKGYFNTAGFQEAIVYFLKMDYEAEKAKLAPEQKSADYYLAMNYQRINQIPVAGKYAKKALTLAKSINDTGSVIRSFYVYATNFSFYYVKGDSTTSVYGDSMLAAVKEIEGYAQKNNPVQMGMVNDVYTKAYDMKRDPLNCKKYALASLNNYRETGDSNNIIACFIILGQAYLETKEYDSALYYSKIAEDLKKGHVGGLISEDQRAFYHSFYEIYKALGKKELALDYLEKWYQQDLLFNEERNLNLQQLRENFETQKADLRIESEKEKTEALYEQKRNFYFYVFGSTLLILTLLVYFLYYRFKNRKEKEQKNLQLLLQNAELTALKAQMNPHFIFNALNSIQHSIVTKNTEEASRFLSKFSKLIRNVLDNSSEQLVPLKTEIETISLYMEIESKRFDNSFRFKIELEENGFDSGTILVPPMLLQPFIENAIWHGLMPKEDEKKLIVSFSIQSEDNIICEISDNGVGRMQAGKASAGKKKTHESKGISNIMDRVRLLEMTHSIYVGIEITDQMDKEGQPSGTKVTVKITKTKNRI